MQFLRVTQKPAQRAKNFFGFYRVVNVAGNVTQFAITKHTALRI